MVPHVVYAPVLFQPVCDAAVAADYVFRGSLFLSFLPHDVGEKRNDELAYISAVVQLSVYELCGSLFMSPNTLSHSTLLKTTNSKRYKF